MRSMDIAEYLGNEHHRMECKNRKRNNYLFALCSDRKNAKKHKEMTRNCDKSYFVSLISLWAFLLSLLVNATNLIFEWTKDSFTRFKHSNKSNVCIEHFILFFKFSIARNHWDGLYSCRLTYIVQSAQLTHICILWVMWSLVQNAAWRNTVIYLVTIEKAVQDNSSGSQPLAQLAAEWTSEAASTSISSWIYFYNSVNVFWCSVVATLSHLTKQLPDSVCHFDEINF